MQKNVERIKEENYKNRGLECVVVWCGDLDIEKGGCKKDVECL